MQRHAMPASLLKAVDRAEHLASRGICLDTATYAALVRECGKASALVEGKRLHALISWSGHGRFTLIGNLLVEMYGKCGSLEDAHATFDKIYFRNVFSWAILIAAYAQNGHGMDAVQLFRQMCWEGVKLDKVAFLNVVNACLSPDVGKLIHACIIETGIATDVALGTALLNMYGKCRRLEDAKEVFDKMPQRDLISWNAMLAAYAQNGQSSEALQLYEQLRLSHLRPDKFTYSTILHCCGVLAEGEMTHGCLVKEGIETDVVVCTALVSMYGRCGNPENARIVFNKVDNKDVVLWTAMILAYAQNACSNAAMRAFREMELEGLKPNKFTFVAILDAFTSPRYLASGAKINSRIVQCGLQADDVVLGTALIKMYGSCGSIEDAREVFDRAARKDSVFWNAMISAYAENEHAKDAIKLLRRMDLEGEKADKFTLASVVDACATNAQEASAEGESIHARVVRYGLETDVVVGTALVNMHAKCQRLEQARRVFDKLKEKKDVISWTCMIMAYARNGHTREALQIFQMMMDSNYTGPDSITLVEVLDAYASLACLAEGKLVHSQLVTKELESEVVVANTLVHMYARCGSLEEARKVFDKMRSKNVVSWSAMVSAYAQHGQGKQAIRLFQKMQHEGVEPNEVTFISILSSCSHSGLVDEAIYCYVCMHTDYNVSASEGHVSHVIDLLGRAGMLGEAEELIGKMAVQDHMVAWRGLLAGCYVHGDAERGARIGDKVLAMDPKDAAPFVLLSNIHAAELAMN